MRVMVLEPGKLAEVVDIEKPCIPAILGGKPKTIFPFVDGDDIAISVDSEGENKGLPLNRSLYSTRGKLIDTFAGTMVIWKEEDDLSDEDVVDLLDVFGEPEDFTEDEDEEPVETFFDFILSLLDLKDEAEERRSH